MRAVRARSRLLPLALALSGVSAFTGPAVAAPAPAIAASPAGDSFEARAQDAVRTEDVGTLLEPFIESCGADMRELDRARCRATTTYLRKTLPQQTFITETSDPAAVVVSGYDAGLKGFRLSLAGCIACTKPMPIGSRHEPRFVTLGTPDKGAASLAAGVPISKDTVTFDDFAAAKHWGATDKPFLQAQFLFQPQADGADFTVGMASGLALKLVGARVYNRCSGKVLVSKPPSTGNADQPFPDQEDPACRGAGQPKPMSDQELANDRRPDELSKTAINEVMEKVRARFYGCYEKFKVPGALVLTYVVGGSGKVQSVQIGPTFAGTDTGACALEVAKEMRFPAFKRERQDFKYLFFLRRS